MHLSDARGKVDFGIITIREDEFEAVLARLPHHVGRVKGRRQYNLRRVPLPGGDSYLVAVLRCIEQGTGEAQSAAHDLLEDLDPPWLFVVGIAGGVPSDEFSLGDVIVSNRIHDFSVEAVLQDSSLEYALAGGPMDKNAAALAANLPALRAELGEWSSAESIAAPRPLIRIEDSSLYGDGSWQTKVRKSLTRHAGRMQPVALSGAIASSDRLIKNTDILAVWLKVARQVLAMEMESAGIYRATYGRPISTLSIRGISDVVGFKRDPEWTRYACHTAAAFMLALMNTRPIEPGAHSSSGAQERKLQSWVAQWPLPRVANVDPYHVLGVTESELARRYARQAERPPYILRDVDSELDKALTMSDLVLLVGHSKAGKSRTAFEAALRLYPQQPLLLPSDGKALVELFRADAPLQWSSDPLIVWLDDLHRFLGPEGLSFSLLNTLAQHKGRVKVLATLTSRRYDDYMNSRGDVEKDIHLILRRFRQVHLSSELNEVETQRAKALYPEEPKEKLADGLGEHFVAADELRLKYDAGKESCPQGYALVRVAIDWRRAGLLRPIPESALQRLASSYIRFLKIPHVDLTPEAYKEGLQWARKPIGIHIALLAGAGQEGSEKSFEAFDYISDHADRLGVGIPDEAWKAILHFASPSEALLLALSAYHRKNKPIMEHALAQAIQSGDPDARPRAIYLLGALYQEDDKLAEAELAYRQVLDAEQTDVASSAMIDLGRLLQNRGEFAEAEQLFQHAFELHDPETHLNATLGLGKLLMDKGEWTKAEALYQGLLESDDARAIALGTVNLAKLHELRDELDAAEALYQKAIESKQPEAAALAMNNLGGLCQNRGEFGKAEQLFRQAMGFQDLEAAALAKANLGTLYFNRGDLAQAEQFYQDAIASKHPFAVLLSTNNLGSVRLKQGASAEARRLYLQALDSRHPDVTPIAAFNLGSLHFDNEEWAEASELLQRAVESKHPEFSHRPKWLLGNLLERQGEHTEAERLYREVLASRQADLIPAAAFSLGSLLQDLERHSEARPLFQQSIDSKHPDFALRATLLLGITEAQQGMLSQAESLFRKLLDSQHPTLSLAGSEVLGEVLEKRGDLIGAEHYYRAATESEDVVVSSAACLHLGTLLLRKGQLIEARRFLQRAVESSDEDVVEEATASMAELVKAEAAPGS
ncbi:tetratricopeptide repeat protein [Hyalangium rubrum]|uniref:Tetratricopeptide repeat protein n=1 Tax=Hyalangium rubrum TaxID=3103134 RepID=A0ABU5H5L6_9BACT|nr:tetratricopeptide repeat protein [Hyalangium sp. s54d21]MDY7227380.1 tetratricopeptide repeat protein [Hyalangium sp. s54d21]